MAEYMINYTGRSMFPTLKTGDILRVVPYRDRDIRVGDVLVFNSSYGGIPIVHRVVAVDQKGIRTKGDNSLRNDDWLLSPNKIVGRVVSVRRGGKSITIFSGFWGRKYVLAVQVVKWINSALLSIILSPVYHWLAGTGIFKELFSRRGSIRLYCFKRGDAMELQVLSGQRIIGRLLPGQTQWYIRRPFRLFIDEASLPGNNPDDLVSAQHAFLEPQRH